MMPWWQITVILFLASLTQNLAGFGVTLVAMPLLIQGLGVRTATPLMVLVSILTQTPLLIRFWSSLRLRPVARLSGAMMVGVPIGVFALRQVNPALATGALGVLVVAYAGYALVTPRLPILSRAAWAYPFGLIAGVLSGAYSTGGPPLIIYGDIQRWEPAEFKGNLQGIFTLAAIMQIVSHTAAGNFTPAVFHSLLTGMPGIIAGTILGLLLERFINAAVFRRVVLILLVVLGIRLLL